MLFTWSASNYPPWLENFFKFTCFQWLEMSSNWTPWLEKISKFTYIKYSFFLSNSIFHFSLELLANFPKSRLKVAKNLLSSSHKTRLSYLKSWLKMNNFLLHWVIIFLGWSFPLKINVLVTPGGEIDLENGKLLNVGI